MRLPKLPINLPENDIENFCKSNHVKKLSLFGSILTNKFTKASDIDFLVQFEKNNIPSLLEIAHMESELTDIVGRKVDLRTAEDLSPYFRDQVIEKAYLLYEQ